MRPKSLRRCSDVLVGNFMRLNHWRRLVPPQKIITDNVSTGTSIRQTYLRRFCNVSLVLKYNQSIWDVVAMTSCYISGTDQLNTLQRRFNWYLNDSDVFRCRSNVLASVRAIFFDNWSLISSRFIKNQNGSEHLH